MTMSMRKLAALAALVVVAASNPASARPVIDCPNASTPFSTRAPLIDQLLSPAAKAVINRELPSLGKGLPPMFASTTPPTFAAILTVGELVRFQQLPTQ